MRQTKKKVSVTAQCPDHLQDCRSTKGRDQFCCRGLNKKLCQFAVLDQTGFDGEFEYKWIAHARSCRFAHGLVEKRIAAFKALIYL
jgi:hypothetical protein